ncbi:hypothetical protein ACU686_41355 [Yinghuangia aomiensis]
MTAGIVIVIIAALILAVGGTLYVVPRAMHGELDVWSYDGTYSMVVGIDGERPSPAPRCPGSRTPAGSRYAAAKALDAAADPADPRSRGGNVGGIRMAEGGKGVVAGPRRAAPEADAADGRGPGTGSGAAYRLSR